MRFSALLILAISGCMAPLAQARALQVMSFEELFKRSDLVVVATPTTRTTDTTEKLVLTQVYLQDANGRGSYMNGIGVETGFKVAVVLKGDSKIQDFTLHHYRDADPGPDPPTNGPMFVRFSLPDHVSYLLFLVREPDGRYSPTSGQVDPGWNAINRLQSPDPFAK